MFVFGNNETQRVHARRSLRDKKKQNKKHLSLCCSKTFLPFDCFSQSSFVGVAQKPFQNEAAEYEQQINACVDHTMKIFHVFRSAQRLKNSANTQYFRLQKEFLYFFFYNALKVIFSHATHTQSAAELSLLIDFQCCIAKQNDANRKIKSKWYWG